MTAQTQKLTSLNAYHSLRDLLVEEGYNDSQLAWYQLFVTVPGCVFRLGGSFFLSVIYTPDGSALFKFENSDADEFGEYRFDSTQDGLREALAQAVADGFFLF